VPVKRFGGVEKTTLQIPVPNFAAFGTELCYLDKMRLCVTLRKPPNTNVQSLAVVDPKREDDNNNFGRPRKTTSSSSWCKGPVDFILANGVEYDMDISLVSRWLHDDHPAMKRVKQRLRLDVENAEDPLGGLKLQVDQYTIPIPSLPGVPKWLREWHVRSGAKIHPLGRSRIIVSETQHTHNLLLDMVEKLGNTHNTTIWLKGKKLQREETDAFYLTTPRQKKKKVTKKGTKEKKKVHYCAPVPKKANPLRRSGRMHSGYVLKPQKLVYPDPDINIDTMLDNNNIINQGIPIPPVFVLAPPPTPFLNPTDSSPLLNCFDHTEHFSCGILYGEVAHTQEVPSFFF